MDISVDEARAKIWMADVKSELEAVETILKSVHTSLGTVVGTDDSIMRGIYKIGTTMETAWNKMCNNFKEAQNKMEEALTKIIMAGQAVIDDAERLAGNVKR